MEATTVDQMNGGTSNGAQHAPLNDPAITVRFDEDGRFLLVDGLKIAKHAKAGWLPIEPGWKIRGGEGIDEMPDAIITPTGIILGFGRAWRDEGRGSRRFYGYLEA